MKSYGLSDPAVHKVMKMSFYTLPAGQEKYTGISWLRGLLCWTPLCF